MRLWLPIAIIVLFLSGNANAGYVQSKNCSLGSTTNTTFSCALTSNVVAGNVIALAFAFNAPNGADLSSITDACGNTYHQLDANGPYFSYYAPVTTGGACTVTINLANGRNYFAMVLEEISGIDGTTPVDQHSVQLQNTPSAVLNAYNAGPVTTTYNQDFIWGATLSQSTVSMTITPGFGFTIRENYSGTSGTRPVASEDMTQTYPGAISATFTPSSSVSDMAFVIAFKTAGSSAGQQINPCSTNCVQRRIQSHAIMFTNSTLLSKQEIAAAGSAQHASMIRIDFSWNAIETSQGVYSWTNEDQSISASQAQGLAVEAVIYGTPSFYSTDPSGPGDANAALYPPTNPAGYAAWVTFLQAAIARYSSSVQYWEIYPEAETSQQWLGTASDYAHLFSVAYTTIKAANSSMNVLIGGMTQNNQPTFFNAVVNDTNYPNANHLDFISAHARGTIAQMQSYISPITGWPAVYALQGITGKPFWITEFGFPSVPTDQVNYDANYEGIDFSSGQADQEAYYNVMVPYLMQNGVTQLFVTTHDSSSGVNQSEGLTSANATVSKPALQVIANFSDQFSSPSVGVGPLGTGK